MILVSKAERDAIISKLPQTEFAYSKHKVFMVESLGAIYELQKLRQVKQAETGKTAARKRRQRRQRKAASVDA